MNGNSLVYLGNWLFEEPLAHLQYAAPKPCSLENRNSFLGSLKWIMNNRAIAAYLFMKYFLCLRFIAIFIHYLIQKAHFHFPKLVNF